MVFARKTSLLTLIMSVGSGGLHLFGQSPRVVTCSQATLTRPGVGRAFRGVVRNDDYKFSATVPEGYTGWDGVAADAPFHGFTIFLDKSLQSCILFEVHVRVDDDDVLPHPPSAKTLSLGQARAWQSSSSGAKQEGRITNLRTTFTFDHGGETDDGQITLIAPAAEQQTAKRVYESFLQSLRFKNNEDPQVK